MSDIAVNPKASRRLAAILAADIAGYSALMGADEEATVRDLKGLETSRCLRIRQLWETPVPASSSARGTPQGRCRRSTESTAPARADRAFRGIGLRRSWRMLGRVRATPHRLFGAAA